MVVGLLTFELHVPDSRSLKGKRQTLRRVKDRLRSRFNVSVAEQERHQALWQRAGLLVAAVATDRDALERLFESVRAEVESLSPGPLIETGRDFLETDDGIGEEWERGAPE